MGSGITPQTWFSHATLYEIDTRAFQDSDGDGIGDLKGIAQRLDYLRSLGVDAILLAPFAPPQNPTQTGQPNPIDPALGTLDDFDELTLQASRLKVRILLDLPSPDPALARFWLSRGVAGFYIPSQTPTGQANTAALQAIRKLLPAYVGQRVLITDAVSPAASSSAKSAANELLLDTALLQLPTPSAAYPPTSQSAAASPQDAAASTLASQIRVALEQSQALLRQSTLLLATDAPGLPRSLDRFAAGRTQSHSPAQDAAISRIVATILMLNRSGPLLYAGQELAVSSPSGTPAPMPWGVSPSAPPSPEPPVTPEPAPAKPAAPPVVPDRYVPYVPPAKPAAPKPAPKPDPATAAGQDLDPRSSLNFYRQLSQLRHGSTALRDGDETFLNFDAQNVLVWVRKPASPGIHNPPVVILCNLSNKPVTLSLKPDLLRLNLRGSFLKTILRSDGEMGAMNLSPLDIPPFGVYIGELKF